MMRPPSPSVEEAALRQDPAAMRFVTLRLLWNCNLRCVMCDHPYKPASAMKPEVAHSVLDQLNSPVRLSFIGGEPCLWLLRHRDVLDRALSDGHHVFLTTNGVLLPRLPSMIDAFADRPVGVQFSIDAIGTRYERLRPPARWRDVLSAVRCVHKKRSEAGNRRAVISVSMVLMRTNLEDLDDVVQFCVQEGVDSLSLTPAIIYESMVARQTISDEDSIFHHRERAANAVRSAVALANLHGLSLGYPGWLASVHEAPGKTWTKPDRSNAPPRRTGAEPNTACNRPWKELFVNQDGRIVPCCCGTGIGPVVGTMESGIENAWNSDRMLDVRRALLDGTFDPACRCGANMSVSGKAQSAIHFFTMRRDSRTSSDG